MLAIGVCLGGFATRASEVLPANAAAALERKVSTVRRLACEARVPPAFALAVLDKESGFDNSIRGSMGEIGVSQILPSTALSLGYDVGRLADEFSYNARAGVEILKRLLVAARGDHMKALSIYRAGPRWMHLPARHQLIVQAYARSILHLMETRYADVGCQ
jgi:soluble lytic murein transglycosylase-like protein